MVRAARERGDVTFQSDGNIRQGTLEPRRGPGAIVSVTWMFPGSEGRMGGLNGPNPGR